MPAPSAAQDDFAGPAIPSQPPPVGSHSAAPGAWPEVELKPDPLYHSILLTMCSGVIVLAFVLSIRGQTQVLVPLFGGPLPELCTFRRFTGLGCPGCGMTRCFISLAHGDLRAAWAYNPSGFLMFALFAFQIPYRIVQLVRIRRGLPELRLNRLTQWSLGIIAVAMFGQWLLRQCGVPL
jgi:hypothetical protein